MQHKNQRKKNAQSDTIINKHTTTMHTDMTYALLLPVQHSM